MNDKRDVVDMYSAYPFSHERKENRILRYANFIINKLVLLKKVLKNEPAGQQFTDIYFYEKKYRNNKPLKTILDAGCGAGLYSTIFAGNNPQSTIIGIDLTPKHIEIAKTKNTFTNLHFFVADITDINDLKMKISPPKEGFDLIFSFGVLHHLPDPQQGLKNLDLLLADDGLFIIYLYDKYAMQSYDNFSEAIHLLSDSLSYTEKLIISKSLLKKPLTEQARYQQLYREKILNYPDWILADALFHPIRHTYSISDVVKFLESSDLELIDFIQINPKSYFISPNEYFLKIRDCIGDDLIYNKMLSQMSNLEKLDLLQLLFDSHSHDGITFVAAKKNQYKPLWTERLG